MVNKVNLLGNVGADPSIREVNEMKVASFSLATSESYKDKQGNKVEKTEWHNLVVWGALAKVVESYVKKGDKLYVEGKISYRSYEDKEGQQKHITEIKVTELRMLGGKKDSPDKLPY